MHFKTFLLLAITIITYAATTEGFTSQEVKCHVCKATVREMEEAISKVDPNKKADVSGFRLDANGNAISKTVQLVKSEIYLTELMEKICEKMDDYVRATYKKNGRFTLLKMIVDGKMNSEASDVDFIQDGDLNKSLGHFCLEILEDQEHIFLEAFQAPTLAEDLDIRVCSEKAKYCKDAPIQEDYEFDDRDEL